MHIHLPVIVIHNSGSYNILCNLTCVLRVIGKMVNALKQLGFDSVLDTDFTADLTIMEEGTELLVRLKKLL
ncbi:MAG TPA: [Fe-Fe] hydrogenase large subunit C-terminal domain-containing protein [Bacteroidales bacterium]|nr:[Fe-Fe] hydrogenase large subunit C-terminal domain-containing protein [Bacteroidales bacterium]